MFTGIIQHMGSVKTRRQDDNGLVLQVSVGELARRLVVGDSVAVNGVCLTAERIDDDIVTFTAVGETLRLTTLGRLDVDTRVNLETAATPTSAMGGHIVQGHVDAIATVRSFEREGDDYLLTLELDANVFPFVIHKASIAIDGVSLTVVDPKPDRTINITIVPHTLEHTIIGDYKSGTHVNVEADVIGKYVFHYMERFQHSQPQ